MTVWADYDWYEVLKLDVMDILCANRQKETHREPFKSPGKLQYSQKQEGEKWQNNTPN